MTGDFNATTYYILIDDKQEIKVSGHAPFGDFVRCIQNNPPPVGWSYHTVIEDAYPLGDFFDPDTLMVIPRAEITVEVQGTTLSNLPVPCTVIINRFLADEASYEIDDGVAELELPHPGSFSVMIIAPRCRTITLEVTAS